MAGDVPKLGESIIVFQEKWARLVLQGSKKLEARHQPIGNGKYWAGILKGCKGRKKKALVVGSFQIVGRKLVKTDEEWQALRAFHCCQSLRKPYATTWCMDVESPTQCQPVEFLWPRGAVGRAKYAPPAPDQATAPQLRVKHPRKQPHGKFRSRKRRAPTWDWWSALSVPPVARQVRTKKRKAANRWGDGVATLPATPLPPGQSAGRDATKVQRVTAGRTEEQLARIMDLRVFLQSPTSRPALQARSGVFGYHANTPVFILHAFDRLRKPHCDVVNLDEKPDGRFLADLGSVQTVRAEQIKNLHTRLRAVPRWKTNQRAFYFQPDEGEEGLQAAQLVQHQQVDTWFRVAACGAGCSVK